MADTATWRLIRSGYLPGAMNMALDDALLHAVAEGSSPPVLRLYRWRPATLTLGYAQVAGEGVDLAACHGAGIDVVRRPTGGRAVYHEREVTYAVIAPAGGCFGNSVNESYRVIAGVLRSVLRNFDLPAELVPGHARGQSGRAVCFTAPAQHELVKRRGPAFLQHGSIPLELDLDLLRRLMPPATGELAESRFHSIGWLNRFASRPLHVDEVEMALVGNFSAELGVILAESEPTATESATAQRLCSDWYGNPEWTMSGPGVRSRQPGSVGN
jgi:lipoate-protein ligase A